MNINFTLFVQAINFFIAYLLFRFILFKPAYREIVQERKEREWLEGLVSADHQLIDDTHKQRLLQWKVAQKECLKYLPEPLYPVQMFRGISPDMTVKTPTASERRVMVERLTQTIVEHVGDDHGA